SKFSLRTRSISTLSSASRSRRAEADLERALVIGGGSNLQDLADRLDPELPPLLVDVADHLIRRPSSSAAKSRRTLQDLVRQPQLPVLLFQLGDPPALFRGHSRPFALIALRLLDPVAQRLGSYPQLPGHPRYDADALAVLSDGFTHHPDRP